MFFALKLAHAQDLALASAFLYLKNNVEIKLKGEAKWYKAYAEDLLREGDEIKTTQDSYAVLYLWDKRSIKMAPSTYIKIINYKSSKTPYVKIKLFSGKIWVSAGEKINSKILIDINAVSRLVESTGTAFEIFLNGKAAIVRVWDNAVYAAGNKISKYQESEFWRKGSVIKNFNPDNPNNWQKWNIKLDAVVKEYGKFFPKYIDFSNKSNKKILEKVRRKINGLAINKQYLAAENKIKVEKNVQYKIDKLLKIKQYQKIIKKK